MRIKFKTIYKVIRSILVTAIVTVVGIYSLTYILLSMTPVQNQLRGIAETELSKFLGGKITIGKLNIYPFNELVLQNVTLSDPQGQQCIQVGRLGAGIDIWRLIRERKIEITYAELIDADIRLWQQTADSKLNIQFLIDAVSPKEKNKPPTKFDLKIRNIVIRKSSVSYDKRWITPIADSRKIDFNHIKVDNLRADIQLPQLKNDDFIVDLRRLAFDIPGKFSLEKLSARAHITNKSIAINNLIIKLPNSEISPSDLAVNFESFAEILPSLYTDEYLVEIIDNKITPSDFVGFYPPLAKFNTSFYLTTEISGNIGDISVKELKIVEANKGILLSLKGRFRNLNDAKQLFADLQQMQLKLTSDFIQNIANTFTIPQNINNILLRLGEIDLSLSGGADLKSGVYKVDGTIDTSAGNLNLDIDATAQSNFRNIAAIGKISTDGIDIGRILDQSKIGRLVMNLDGHIDKRESNIEGKVAINVPSVEFNGRKITNIIANAEKSSDLYSGRLEVDDPSFGIIFDGFLSKAGSDSHLVVQTDLRHFVPSDFLNTGILNGYVLNGQIGLETTGDTPDNILGQLLISDFSAMGGSKGDIKLDKLLVESKAGVDNYHELTVHSDFADIDIRGEYTPTKLPVIVQGILSQLQPTFIKAPEEDWHIPADVKYTLTIKNDSDLFRWLNVPIQWYDDMTLQGEIIGDPGKFTLSTSIPYMVQGRDKLIRDTSLSINLQDDGNQAEIILGTIYPTKKGDLRLDVELTQINNYMMLTTWFNRNLNTSFKGSLQMGASINKPYDGKGIEAMLHIYPSICYLNKAEWKIDAADISYQDGLISVNGFNVHHDDQFVNIAGIAGPSADDIIDVGLANIDLSYIFDTLNINFVNFGGYASGEVEASQLLSGIPVAATKKLFVKGLAYNGAVLGDGDISSHWDNEEKCITIDALIKEGNRQTVDMKGGIWVTRDSLSFDFNTDKVNVSFLQPFMSAFADKFEGRASGHALLYGTFKDIDLKGRVYADTVNIKLGFTNVSYSGSDSVIIDPGRIHVPDFKLYDKYGHTAVLGGDLTHYYFHEPSFNFHLKEVDNFLLYDTNNKLNPDWYGTIFGTGTGNIIGRPGYVKISADMTTQRNSTFTFVLNDRQDAGDYQFLTFSDKKKELEEAIKSKSAEEEFLERFKKKNIQQEGPPTIFEMDLRVQATPEAALTIVMDPAGGDKITARGNGNMNIGYSSADDEMTMFGKYTLEKGTYNFTLQDLILKDFTIRPGSTISFTGDPLDANLNITAAYRVNTNLTDLDKSFATDKELNRTNVPVDALLNVTGDMTQPNVSFDIDLPTLTEETARKVRSIISTEDMMSRQIIYLLALNRFYTPEYMGMSSNGGEWASVASSTLSSQLSNMLGQLTDKVNLMPSLRSDKGDFSDLEVDLALSSQLLNNRLIINGNFGYRDRSTSSTTFVGDFDIEYLLNSSGNLRLKAYNHFNDQNYYLRSALTTQGLGIIYRKDFDNPFTFLRRKKKTKEDTPTETPDTVRSN